MRILMDFDSATSVMLQGRHPDCRLHHDYLTHNDPTTHTHTNTHDQAHLKNLFSDRHKCIVTFIYLTETVFDKCFIVPVNINHNGVLVIKRSFQNQTFCKKVYLNWSLLYAILISSELMTRGEWWFNFKRTIFGTCGIKMFYHSHTSMEQPKKVCE